MKRRITFFSTLLLAFFCLAGLTASAQDIADFSLKNYDGESVTLSQYKEKKAIVVVFTGNHCVYSKKYEERLVKMGTEYQEKEVQFILINANNPVVNQEENQASNAQRAKEKAFPFPYLQDADHAVADNFGATKQPEVFVLVPATDDAGSPFTLVYTGRVDDNPLMAEKVNENYLKTALDKVLGGDSTPTESTDPTGCNIRF
jgi:peroxiredoxin